MTFLLQKDLDAIHYSLFVCKVDQLYIQGMWKCVTPGLCLQHQDFETMMVITWHLRPYWNQLCLLGHTMLSAHLGKKCFTPHTTNLKSLYFSPAVCQIKVFHF